jgi:eukaryotic-like serine/threonine-protein kinase
MIGTVIEHYKIMGMLGEGGMGVVYKAFDLKLERYVALKILNSGISNPNFIERFKREAKNQAKFTHQNIVPVYGFTEAHGILGIVMEYTEGETLESLIIRRGRLRFTESLTILKQILTGVSYAHQKGFIHRDIKPSNIIIDSSGTVKLMDFGISKSLLENKSITKTGAKVGTILYMSPEQIKGNEPTVQSDLYSTGITFYEMLYGKNPFDIGTEYEIMEAHLKKNPPKLSTMRADVPTEADKILAKALNKSLDKRYASCEDFLFDVDAILHKTGTVHSSNNADQSPGKTPVPPRKKSYLSLAIFLFSLTVIFIAVYAYLNFLKDTQFSHKESAESLYSGNPLYQMKSSWRAVDMKTASDFHSIFFVNEKTGFICGQNSTILKTEDGGATWSLTNFDSAGVNLYSLYFVDERRGVAVGESGVILRSTDSGETWNQSLSSAGSSLFNLIENEKKLSAVGGGGTLLVSTNTGSTWERKNLPLNNLCYSIVFPGDRIGYISGWQGMILKTSNSGNDWNQLEKFTDAYLKDIFFVDVKTGYAVGGGGEIFKTVNGGEKWKRQNSGTINALNKVIFFDKENGIILSGKGEILTSSNGGDNWTISSSGKFTALTSIAFLPSGKMFIAGASGLLLTNY